MDVGTAKPSASEREGVPHHLVDIIDPTEAYSAARFRADALRLMDEITARGRTPLLVGGTMLTSRRSARGCRSCPSPTRAFARDSMPRQRRAAGRRSTQSSPRRSANRRPAETQRRAAYPAGARSLSGEWRGDFAAARTQKARCPSLPPHRARARSLRSQRAAPTHRSTLRCDAEKPGSWRSSLPSRTLRAAAGLAFDALRRVSASVAVSRGRIRSRRVARPRIFATRQLAKRQLTGCAGCRAFRYSTV